MAVTLLSVVSLKIMLKTVLSNSFIMLYNCAWQNILIMNLQMLMCSKYLSCLTVCRRVVGSGIDVSISLDYSWVNKICIQISGIIHLSFLKFLRLQDCVCALTQFLHCTTGLLLSHTIIPIHSHGLLSSVKQLHGWLE